MTTTLDHDGPLDTLDLNLDVTLFADGVYEQDGSGVTMAYPWVTLGCRPTMITRYVCTRICPSSSCY